MSRFSPIAFFSASTRASFRVFGGSLRYQVKVAPNGGLAAV